MSDWRPDPLGPGWEQRDLVVGEDEHGPVLATLVRSVAVPAAERLHGAVLHVHGFNDYFFQAHVAPEWEERGWAVHAVDLRGCGRSMRPGRLPHFVTDLTEYAADLSAAARAVLRESGARRLVVVGHSTGGLTAALWSHALRRVGVPSALVLNSPWFDLNARWFHRVVSTRVLDVVGPLDPTRVVASGPSAYSHHLHVDHGGRWDYDLALKPSAGFPVRAGWLRAVRRGQARLAQGLRIPCPVLVLSSDASGPNRLDNPDLDRQDTVLDVAAIALRAPLLGPDVTYVPVPGGVHDLSLSAPGPRERYLATVLDWLDGLDGLGGTPPLSAPSDVSDARGAGSGSPTLGTPAGAARPPARGLDGPDPGVVEGGPDLLLGPLLDEVGDPRADVLGDPGP